VHLWLRENEGLAASRDLEVAASSGRLATTPSPSAGEFCSPAATDRLTYSGTNLLFFLSNYVVAEYKAHFSSGSELVVVHALGTEHVTRGEAVRVGNGKVRSKEEATVLKGRRCRKDVAELPGP